MADRDKHGRDANEMTRHYNNVEITNWSPAAFVIAVREAALVMGYLEAFGSSCVPHLMDDDENPGERLRDALRTLGIWESA